MENGPDFLSYHRPTSRPLALAVRIGILTLLLGGVVFLGTVVWMVVAVRKTHEKTVARAVAPQSGAICEWVQLSRFIDHNYQLRLQPAGGGMASVVFESPDEGMDDGRTATLWSADGTRILVLMTYVNTRAGTPELVDGRKAYLLYDLRNGSILCNASQLGAAPITIADLAAFVLPAALAIPTTQQTTP